MLEEGKIYKEQEIVQLIGTDSQKASYEENGRFVSNYKNRFLKQLSKYCQFKEYKNKRYKIIKVYKDKVPDNIKTLSSGMYQYMIPAISKLLLENKTHTLQFTLDQWAIEIKMIKPSYSSHNKDREDLVRVNQDITYKMVADFFSHSNSSIYYYFNQTLVNLKKLGIIEYFIIPYVKIPSIVYNENGQAEIIYTTREATLQEREKVQEFYRQLDKDMNIKTPWERYNSYKSEEYHQRMKKLLHSIDIELYFTVYELHAGNLDRIDTLLEQMNEYIDIEDKNVTIDNAYANYVMDNTMKRYDKDTKHKYEEIYNNRETCKAITQKFCEYAIIR